MRLLYGWCEITGLCGWLCTFQRCTVIVNTFAYLSQPQSTLLKFKNPNICFSEFALNSSFFCFIMSCVDERLPNVEEKEKTNADVSVLQPVYILWTPAPGKGFPFKCLIRWCDNIALYKLFSSWPPAPSYKADLKPDSVNIYDPAWQ